MCSQKCGGGGCEGMWCVCASACVRICLNARHSTFSLCTCEYFLVVQSFFFHHFVERAVQLLDLLLFCFLRCCLFSCSLSLVHPCLEWESDEARASGWERSEAGGKRLKRQEPIQVECTWVYTTVSIYADSFMHDPLSIHTLPRCRNQIQSKLSSMNNTSENPSKHLINYSACLLWSDAQSHLFHICHQLLDRFLGRRISRLARGTHSHATRLARHPAEGTHRRGYAEHARCPRKSENRKNAQEQAKCRKWETCRRGACSWHRSDSGSYACQ